MNICPGEEDDAASATTVSSFSGSYDTMRIGSLFSNGALPTTPTNMDLDLYLRLSMTREGDIAQGAVAQSIGDPSLEQLLKEKVRRAGVDSVAAGVITLEQQQQEAKRESAWESGSEEDPPMMVKVHDPSTYAQHTPVRQGLGLDSPIGGSEQEMEQAGAYRSRFSLQTPVPEELEQPSVQGTPPSEPLLQMIHRTIAAMPQGKVFARWYDDKNQVDSTMTFHGVWAASGEVAYLLRVTLGLSKGDRVVLAFNFGLRFFVVFLGCLRAGIIAVPVYPPNPATLKKSLRKLQLIVDSCEPKMILLCPLVNKLRLASKLRAVATGNSGWPDLPYNCPEVREEPPSTAAAAADSSSSGGWWRRGGGAKREAAEKPKSFDDPSIKAEDVAFLQFTSGSTSDPKGVMLTFGNLGHNIGAVVHSSNTEIAARGGPPQGERVWFSWLPTFHDMGLIQGTLVPFVGGWTASYCSPISFLRRPLIWLELMSKEKAQMTAAPDFAFRLCTRKWKEMAPEARAALNLDLSHVMFMQNAAEPIRVSTVRDFAETFFAVGLPAYALNTAYGLAEHTVGCAAFSCNQKGADVSSLSDERLQASGDLSYAAKFGSYIKIVDPETSRELPVGETGEMWVSSDSVAAGYWGKPELTRETFHARIECDTAEGNPPPWAARKFLRTGDLCRVDAEGLLYVEGRLKDLIIVAGRNIYPQDIEFVAQDASPLVRPGCVAAFSKEELGGDLQIVMEVRKTAKKDACAVLEALEAVRTHVMNEFGLCPAVVVAIKERTIPKTTSGKIQRRKTRSLLKSGGLDVVQKLLSESESFPAAPAAARAATRAVAPAPVDDPEESGTPSPSSEGTLTEPTDGGTPRPSSASWSGSSGSVRVPMPSAAKKASSSSASKGFAGEERKEEAFVSAGVALQVKDVLDILQAATGIEGLEESDDLLNLGVDSLASVGISSKLSEASGFEIPPELVFTHSTATQIAEYIGSLTGSDQGNMGISLRASGSSKSSADMHNWNCAGGSLAKEGGEAWTTRGMRGWAFRLTQVLLLVLVIAQILIALYPAWYYWTFIESLASTPFRGLSKQPWLFVDLPVFGKGAEGTGTVRALGLLQALAPVAWFLSFTAMVIANKWLVLGAQAQWRAPLGTHAYLAWWYTNAMLTVWETIGGRWLQGTKLMILFYRLMGAKVAWTADVKGFLRDFDSIEIGEGAKVEGQLYARRFEASHMNVMPIVVGRGATVGAGTVVYGGTDVGENCVIRPMTVIPPFTKLAPNSIWEGHPARKIGEGSGGGNNAVQADSEGALERRNYSRAACTFYAGALVMELVKQASIVATLMVMVSMTFLPTILYESMRISNTFRYALLVSIALRVIGVGAQLAFLTVLLKWILAGSVSEGPYRPTAFSTWRRWYLGRLHTLVHTYFIVFNRYRRYDWWGAALGIDVGRGSIILLGYNPEDAHLLKVGRGAHVASPIISVDHSSGTSGEREKRAVSIGSHAMIGLGSYLGAGVKVGDGSMLGGYAMLRQGEEFAEGMATMCDLQSAFPRGGHRSESAYEGAAESSRQACAINVADAACTLGAWLVLVLSMVASFETTKWLASLWPGSVSGVGIIVLGTVAFGVWALASSLLLFVFKSVLVGDFRGSLPTGKGGAIVPEDDGDLESGQGQGGDRHRTARKYEANTLRPSQVIRWRWMRRVLNFSLFEPFVIDPFLKGTWLLNAWLRLMGADVSMGALILGRVADYGMIKIRDGAVVAGVVYGHTVTFVDGKWSMQIAPSTIGERAVVHDHARVFCMHMDAGSTITATSSSLSGQVLKAGEVYGGRPSKTLTGTWLS